MRHRFLSTPSGWRATPAGCRLKFHLDISIHALRVEGDSYWYRSSSRCTISIHALRVEGDRTYANFLCSCAAYFYPRPPGGGRLSIHTAPARSHKISIHALRVEGDHCLLPPHSFLFYFYPRPPGGGRQQKRTKFSSVFAQKGEEFASLRRGKRKICRWRFKKGKFWVLIWCEGSGKSVCALASHCG